MPRHYSMAKRREEIGRTRARIEEALILLLARKPYSVITMGDIAAEADVSERTVRRHYGSKDDILTACISGPAREMAEETATRGLPGSAAEAIRYLVDLQFAFYGRRSAEVWAAYSRMDEVPELGRAVQLNVEARRLLIEGLLAAWPDAWSRDREETTRLVDAMVSFPVWRGLTDFGRLSGDEAAQVVYEALCQQLLCTPGEGSP